MTRMIFSVKYIKFKKKRPILTMDTRCNSELGLTKILSRLPHGKFGVAFKGKNMLIPHGDSQTKATAMCASLTRERQTINVILTQN